MYLNTIILPTGDMICTDDYATVKWIMDEQPEALVKSEYIPDN